MFVYIFIEFYNLIFISSSVKYHLMMICHTERFYILLQTVETKQMEIVDSIRKQFENIQKFRKFDKLKRVVQKDGTTTVLYKNISKKRRRYFYDFYTTLLDSSWSELQQRFFEDIWGGPLILEP